MPKIDETTLKYRRCCVCENNTTYINSSGSASWFNCKCGKKDCSGYLCNKCYEKSPDSRNSAIKSINKSRNAQIDIHSENGKGIVGEVVIAKVRKLKVLSIELDNFTHKFDLSRDYKYGMIQSKFKVERYREWSVTFGAEHNFDTLFVLCVDKNGIIRKVYAIPEDELYGNKSVTITENGLKYKKFRIDQMLYNGVYHDIIYYLGNNRFFGVKDVKKWLGIDYEEEAI